MTYRTHLIGGAQAGLLLAAAGGGTAADSLLIAGTAMAGALLPDIDHTRSKLANTDLLVGAISRAISRVTRHRGFTHTIPGAIAFAALFYVISVFNTSWESLGAASAAIGGYLLMQSAAAFRRYGMLSAAAAYLLAPRILECVSSGGLKLSLSPESAMIGAVGILAGCLSHMLYDMFNSKGIMLFWPLTDKSVRLASIRTRSTGERMFGFLMLLVLMGISVCVFKDTGILELLLRLKDEAVGMMLGAFAGR